MHDYSEAFAERPKNLDAPAATWLDYKFHNTKFLKGISPIGLITFLSETYGGRANEKFICSDSSLFYFLDNYDEVMADRRFQITEELMMNSTLAEEHVKVTPTPDQFRFLTKEIA